MFQIIAKYIMFFDKASCFLEFQWVSLLVRKLKNVCLGRRFVWLCQHRHRVVI